ncbi:hypothetical protein FACS189445_0770 [Spirochaetia bacterium]|nr:hypothetical protein FACS189445_0770 [Spirochaetia bacterium]
MVNRWFMMLLTLTTVAGLAASCVSTTVYKPLTQEERGGIEIAGSVQCDFYSITYLGAGRISRANQQQAYIELMKEANKMYQGIFDIRDITVAYVGINTEHGNEFTANGTVVLLKNGAGTN